VFLHPAIVMVTQQEKKAELSSNTPQVLVVFFSFSGQTAGLLSQLILGLKEGGAEVVLEKLRPLEPLHFPVGSFYGTNKLMLTTFLRFQMPVKKISAAVIRRPYNLIILAGPTWSYNPSGPVLSLLENQGEALFENRTVLPMISCRGYWRFHWFGLRRLLKKCGATVPNVVVFSHPNREPWRTIGVFLKIAGKNPERSKIFGKYYPHYGHSKKQRDEAWRFGLQIGEALCRERDLSGLDFKTPLALP
jgi:hypothetical protein